MLLLAVVFSTGCVSSGELRSEKSVGVEDSAEKVVDEVSAATSTVVYWDFNIEGIRDENINQKLYWELKKTAMTDGSYKTLVVERKGVASTYTGIPLKNFIARIDGEDWREPFEFDLAKWESGYEVTLTAMDGYSATFTTAEVNPDSFYVYDQKDGQAVKPGIIGKDVSSKYLVNDLASIQCALFTDDAAEDLVMLEIVINGEQNNFSRTDLTKTPYYITGKGGFTTSAGTYFENIYGGIRFADFLQSFISLGDDNTVTLIAKDGYSMSYEFSELKNIDDGIWILAFEMDGEYMADDPGPFRGVKVASDSSSRVPNIEGHSSPKMVKRVEISAEAFRDFSLLVKGRMESTLDRATIQAGINCTAHKTAVSYFNKKTGELESYTGIPLFALLAYGDDSSFAPHKQTAKDVLAYDKAAALAGYQVKISAADGYSVTLDSREVDGNNDVIIAMYQGEDELSDVDWPLKLVWDERAEVVPTGIKAVRNVVSIELIF